MPYLLNGDPIHGDEVVINDVAYSMETLMIMGEAGRASLGVTWVEPPAATLAERLAELAEVRWQRTQTFEFDDVRTLADSAIAVVNATLTMRQRRSIPPAAKQAWKLADGEFREWDEAEIEAFGFAIADHIQACFDREAALTIALTEAEDPSSIDIMAGWP